MIAGIIIFQEHPSSYLEQCGHSLSFKSEVVVSLGTPRREQALAATSSFETHIVKSQGRLRFLYIWLSGGGSLRSLCT